MRRRPRFSGITTGISHGAAQRHCIVKPLSAWASWTHGAARSVMTTPSREQLRAREQRSFSYPNASFHRTENAALASFSNLRPGRLSSRVSTIRACGVSGSSDTPSLTLHSGCCHFFIHGSGWGSGWRSMSFRQEGAGSGIRRSGQPFQIRPCRATAGSIFFLRRLSLCCISTTWRRRLFVARSYGDRYITNSFHRTKRTCLADPAQAEAEHDHLFRYIALQFHVRDLLLLG